MPTRISKACYPRFSAATAGDVSKNNHATYDTDEETERHHDLLVIVEHNDAAASTSRFAPIDLGRVSLASSSQSSPSDDEDNDDKMSKTNGSNSNTENLTQSEQPHEDEGSIGTSISLSDQHSQVSWSESDGSTYVSEDSLGAALAVRPVRKVTIVTTQVPDIEDDRPTPKKRGGNKSKVRLSTMKKQDTTTVAMPSDEGDGEMFDINIMVNQGKDDIVTKEPQRASAKRSSKNNKTKKATLAEEADALMKNFMLDAAKMPDEKPPLCYQYSASPPNVPEVDPLRLKNVNYYSNLEVASTNDGLSVTDFLSKQDTHLIFCRRLIPLEIPIDKDAQDDVSAVSTVNDSESASIVPSVQAGDNSEMAVQTRRGTTTKHRSNKNSSSTHKKLTKVVSKEDLPMGYNMPYSNNVSQKRVPMEIPIDDISPAHVSTHQDSSCMLTKMVLRVPLPSREASLSSLDSDASVSEPSDELDDLCFGDDGSDDAVRPTREKSTKSERKNKSEKRKQQEKRKAAEKKIVEKRSSKKLLATCEKARSQKRSKEHQSRSGTVFPEQVTAVNNRTSREGNGKRTSGHTKSKQQQQPEMANLTEEESSTDRRIRELKKKIHHMQHISKLQTAAKPTETMHPKKEMPSPRRQDTKKAGQHGKLPANQRPKSTIRKLDNSTSKPKRVLDNMNERLKLYNVDYLETIDTASNDKDLSILEVGVSKEDASKAFVARPVPLEVPMDDMDDVSTIQCEVERIERGSNRAVDEVDLENGLRNDYERVPTSGHPDHKKSPSKVALNKAKREVSYYLRKVMTGAKAANANVTQRSGPMVESFKERLAVLWGKYMEGRSKTEQVVICLIALSVFILFILLIAVVAK